MKLRWANATAISLLVLAMFLASGGFPAPLLAAEDPLVLYDDAVASGFWDGSFGYSSRNPCDTTTKTSGACSYAIALDSAGGVDIGKDGGFSIAGYTHLEFDINPMGQEIATHYFATLLTHGTNGDVVKEIFITVADVVETLPDGWLRIAIPVSELNPQGIAILSVQIKNESPAALQTINLDQIRFVTLVDGPPPSCESGFADVPDEHPACEAISYLAFRAIIKGFATTPPTFGPDVEVQRAQLAAFIVRALDWQNKPTGPLSFSDFGGLVAELRNAALILANQCDQQDNCAARGYGDGRFGPNDPVTHAQVISFVARSFRFAPEYDWQPQADPHPYSGVPAAHDADVRTYHHYAGAIPDVPTTAEVWNSPASRAWVARVLYQAIQTAP